MKNRSKLSKQEHRKQHQQEKETERTRTMQNLQLKKKVTWIVGIIVILASGYWGWSVTSLKTNGQTRLEKNVGEPAQNIGRPWEEIRVLGAQHIAVGGKHRLYNSNPPTSGAHYAQAARWGVYKQELADEQVIHNLEHGGIWISYKKLNPGDIEILENIGKQFPGRTVVSPRKANDSNIAVASWGRLMKLDTVNKEAIIEYINRNTNKSPERLAR